MLAGVGQSWRLRIFAKSVVVADGEWDGCLGRSLRPGVPQRHGEDAGKLLCLLVLGSRAGAGASGPERGLFSRQLPASGASGEGATCWIGESFPQKRKGFLQACPAWAGRGHVPHVALSAYEKWTGGLDVRMDFQ